MASVRERIMAALEAAVNGAGKPAGLNVHRQRRRPIDRDKLPATVVYAIREDVRAFSTGPIRDVERRLRVRLEHRATGAPEDQVLDPYLVWGTKALKADETLGGLCREINEVLIEWDGEQADQVYAGAGQEFEVIYETTEADPETGAL